MNYQKKCPVCGKRFTTIRETQQYCGEICRKAARKKYKLEWNRTARAAERTHREQARELSTQNRAAEAQARAEQARTEFNKRVAAGDTRALLMKEMKEHGRSRPEYWRLFAQAEIEYYEAKGQAARTYINNISVYDIVQDPDRIIESIAATGVIHIQNRR